MMTFIDLPSDILLTFLHFLDPLDIIHVGQVCKILHDFCEQRTVWTSTARRIRAENAVFPRFPVHNDYSIDSLRRETTAPARFVSLLKNSHASNYTVLPRWSRFVLAPVEGEVFTTIRLIPGGHVLVTASKFALRIWDVDGEQPCLLHSWDLMVSDILAMSRTKENDLRLAIVVRTPKKRVLELHILDYAFRSSTPTSRRFSLDAWVGSRYFPVHALSEENFIFIIGPVLHVWNFVYNEYGTWSAPADAYIRIDSETIPQVFLFFTQTKVYGWEPIRSNSATNESAQLSPLTLAFTLDIPPFTSGEDLMQRSLATWYGSSEFSLIFDFATKVAGESVYTFYSYEIHPPRGDGTPGYVEQLSTDLLPKRPSAIYNFLQIYVYRVADNRLFKTWFNDTDYERPPSCFKVAFRNNPRTPNSCFKDDPYIEVDLKLPAKLGLEGDPDGVRMNDANLDPSSGRFCYLLYHSNRVGVVDYLPK